MQHLMEYDPTFVVPASFNWTELTDRVTVMVDTLTSGQAGNDTLGMLLPPGVDVQEMERQANELMKKMEGMTADQWLQ